MKFPKLPFFRKKPEPVIYRYVTPPRTASAREAHEGLSKLEESASKLKPFDHIEHMDTKRSQIALIFVWGYLALVFTIIIGVPSYNLASGHASELQLDKTLAQIGGLLGTPLGFVVGYYFKDEARRK